MSEDDKPIPDTHRIAIAGKNTRFGAGGADPSAAAKKRNTEQNPSSVRAAQRRLAVSEVDITQAVDAKQLAKMFGKDGTRITIAQAIAVTRVRKAIAGDARFSQFVTDDLDGKLVEKKMEARVSLADLVLGSLEDETDDAESQPETPPSEG